MSDDRNVNIYLEVKNFGYILTLIAAWKGTNFDLCDARAIRHHLL